MSTNVIQTSFAGGELSPTLYARVDLTKYHIGAARLRNFFVDYRGGASNRTGLEFIARVRDPGTANRLIPFQFSVFQNYILEFGNFTMRIIKDGAQVLDPTLAITAVTNANPGVFTVPLHGFATNDEIYILALGMTQVNNKNYIVNVLTANTFNIKDYAGNIINTSGFGAFISGTVARVTTIVTPYAATDVNLLKFTQSADTMTITHHSYPPYNLIRFTDRVWTFTAISIGSTAVAPGVPVVTPTGGAGTTNYAYRITSVNAAGEESVHSPPGVAVNAIDIRAVAGSVLITWAAVPDAVSYNVYKALPLNGTPIVNGLLYGYMTTVFDNAAVDTNIVPDFTIGSPENNDPFSVGNYPSTVTYDQQRRVYAGTDLYPETFWMSRPGQFNNFDTSTPTQPDDSITGTLVSRQVNNIKHMVSMPGGLIMLTGGGAWQVSGGSAGAVLSPLTITATPQAYNGCADVEPLTINYDILYVQQRGSTVRDLSYSFYTNIYTGTDLSIYSNHLFTGYTIVQWTFAEDPFKVVWAVRSDGALLSLTYLKDQEIAGWARHDTKGRFKSIASIQEGQENAVYVIVERIINGVYTQFIERMHTRQMPYGAEDAFFVDSGLSYEGILPSQDLTVALSTGTRVPFTSTGTPFPDASIVGYVIRAGGGIATITDFISTSSVLCTITKEFTDVVPYTEPPQPWIYLSGDWSLSQPITHVTGLDHLEGQMVSILGDGNVFPQQAVLNGAVTLSQPCSKIHIGLSYVSQLQTLYLDVGEPTIQGKRKNIAALTARVDQTRGLKMGPSFNDLVEFKERDLNTIGQPIALFTGDDRMLIGGGWSTEAQLCIQQDNPLPATILGVIPEIQVGDTGK